MIWATVSYQSLFGWLYRASPSLAAKNIINQILALTIWWCPCVESSLALLEDGVCYDQCVLLAELSLCPASFLLQGQICLLLQVFLYFLLSTCHPGILRHLIQVFFFFFKCAYSEVHSLCYKVWYILTNVYYHISAIIVTYRIGVSP